MLLIHYNSRNKALNSVKKNYSYIQNSFQKKSMSGFASKAVDEVEQVSDIVSNNGDAGSIITKDILGSPLEFN